MANTDKPPLHVIENLPPEAYENGPNSVDGVHTKPQQNATVVARQRDLAAAAITSADVEVSTVFNCLIYAWLEVGGFSCIFGAPNSGKTFMALDIGAHIATGEDWFGHEVTQGKVLYVACEGGRGIRHRMVAMRQKLPLFEGAPFMMLPETVNLFDGPDTDALIMYAQRLEPALIIIDTLARSMAGGDESKTKDMNIFVANCERVRKATGSHIMVIHHSGKEAGKGARGSNALLGAVDTEIEVVYDRVRDLICTKQKEMPYPQPQGFALRQVKLGVDDRGYDITSCIVEGPDPIAAQIAQRENQSRSDWYEQRVLELVPDYESGNTVTAAEIHAEFGPLPWEGEGEENSIDPKYLGNILRKIGKTHLHIHRVQGKASLFCKKPKGGHIACVGVNSQQ